MGWVSLYFGGSQDNIWCGGFIISYSLRNFGAAGLNVFIGGAAAIPGATGPVEATADSELRFFAAFWIGYGLMSLWVGLRLQERRHFVIPIALCFLLGGIGRLISSLSIGLPSGILIGAMVLEFISFRVIKVQL